jgi:IS5 family transposase
MSDLDFFRGRLEYMVDMRQPLAVLATRMPWGVIEQRLASLLRRPVRTGRHAVVEDLFGTSQQIRASGVSAAGRPRVPIRLMASLLYLKHAYGLSDEQVTARWSQDVVFQFFSGQVYFENRPPCDASLLSRFRTAVGEAGVEELLAVTISTAANLGAVKAVDFERVTVDTTVQEKAVAYPNDSRLLEVARKKVVRQAKREGIALKQTYDKEGKTLVRRATGYAHARQFNRLKRVIARQQTILGVLLREIERKFTDLGRQPSDAFKRLMTLAWRIQQQKRSDKAKDKVLSLYAPEVECIGKGKARQPYEFGVKVGIVTSHTKGLIVGARSFANNPFDGHTLSEQLEQTGILLQELNVHPKTVIVDLGYRGVDHDNPDVRIIHRGKIKGLSKTERRWLKRRQAIEPVIGHLKEDHGMRRNWLKGQRGDAINAVLCAAGFNLQWLLRAIARLGIQALWQFLCALIRPAPCIRWLAMRTQHSAFAPPSALGLVAR